MDAEAVTRLDVRLVPAALAAWAVTAAGILWPVGIPLAAGCLVVAIIAAVTGWRRGGTVIGISAAAVAGTAVLGAGFAAAVALRSDAVREHPLSHQFGTTSSLTVTLTESPGRWAMEG